MRIQFRYISNPINKYTFLLLASAIIGVNFLIIDLGFVQLSVYRILILLSPLVYLYVSKESRYRLWNSKNFIYFQFLLLWLVYSILSLLWIKDFSAWIKSFFFLLCGCISSWFIGLYFTKRDDWENALKIFEGLAFIFGIIGIYEIITGNYYFIPEEMQAYYENVSSHRSSINMRIPISIFGNPNNFALFNLFAIFGSIALTGIKKTFKGKFLSLISIFFFIFLLIATQSRSGFIGFILGIVFLIYLYLNRFSLKKRLILIIISLFIFLLISSFLISRKELYEPLVAINRDTGSDLIRINLIKNGLVFLYDTYFMGVGLGHIEYHMSTHAINATYGIINIHNWWMEILVSSGIFIFIFYLIIYIRSLWKLFLMSRVSKDNDTIIISICFFCFLIAFILGAMGPSSLMISSEWLWPIMALIMNFVNVDYLTDKT